MTTILTEDFDALSDGTALTYQNTAFDSPYSSGAATITANSSDGIFKTGTTSGKWVCASNARNLVKVWALSSDLYARYYLHVPAGGATVNAWLGGIYQADRVTGIMQVRLNTRAGTAPNYTCAVALITGNTGSPANSQKAVSTAINFNTTTYPSGRWIRIEYGRVNNSLNAELRVAWGSYLDSAITATTGDGDNGTYASGQQAIETTANLVNAVTIVGCAAATTGTYYFDAFKFDDTTWVGPIAAASAWHYYLTQG